MLTKKHIEQYAEYLLEEYKIEEEIQKSLPDSIWEIMVDMYIKGYADCMCDDSLIMERS